MRVEERVFVVIGAPLVCQVSFSIPTREKWCSFVVIGAPSRVSGMIFNTHDGVGVRSFLRAGYDF